VALEADTKGVDSKRGKEGEAVTRYWLRGSQGREAILHIGDDGTVTGLELAQAMRLTGFGPWLVTRRDGNRVRYLGLLDQHILSQDGTRLADEIARYVVHHVNGDPTNNAVANLRILPAVPGRAAPTTRYQLLGQLLPLTEA